MTGVGIELSQTLVWTAKNAINQEANATTQGNNDHMSNYAGANPNLFFSGSGLLWTRIR